MDKRQIGIVKALFRYPVKSMLGEGVDEFEVSAKGVVGDRAYALREVSGRVVTAKKWANMLEFSARYDSTPAADGLAPIRIELPGGRAIHAQDPDASTVLSTVLGRKVTLERRAPSSVRAPRSIPGRSSRMFRWKTFNPGSQPLRCPIRLAFGTAPFSTPR
jgi:uncharacterized protein YcbX